LTDLTFNGGIVGASVANQQFTIRNLVFNNCFTAISQLWDWGWVYQGISINNFQKGIGISAGGTSDQEVGSIALIDSTITNTPIGIITAHTSSSSPATAGSLIIENLQLNNVPTVIQLTDETTVLVGTSGTLTIAGWDEGYQYTPSGPSQFEGPSL
jgi:glucan 1,3-beta-glucosidase